jgi:hypothetical protein
MFNKSPHGHLNGPLMMTNQSQNTLLDAQILVLVVCSLFNDAFQYFRLYNVDFYSILIRLPSSSEAGETQVRNMDEFCRRIPIVLIGFFYMP